MRQHRYKLHDAGPALWPEHKPLDEVLELQATTPAHIWEATYQGRPTAPGGQVFKRKWFRQRFDAADIANQVIGRWLSCDTAMKAKQNSAFTAICVGEMMPDYRLFVRELWRGRWEFPDLSEEIEAVARRHNYDGKLKAIIIEDKSSGTSAIQTLQASSEDWLARLIVGFSPSGSKEERAEQSATWCKNGSVILPEPSFACKWLATFEEEFFNFPQSRFADQIDSFSQLVIYLENYLASGWRARNR